MSLCPAPGYKIICVQDLSISCTQIKLRATFGDKYICLQDLKVFETQIVLGVHPLVQSK